MDTAARLSTYADLLALDEGVRAEVLGGEIITHPSPLPEHGRAQGAIRRFVGGPFDDDDGRGGPGGWWILIEIDAQLTEHDVVRPDLAGWRRERLLRPWGKRPLDVAPDWVCEVLSPSSERYDRVHKATLYADAGVQHYWMIDPGERLLEAFELAGGRWLRLGAWDEQASVAIPPFAALTLEIGRLFPPPGDAHE